MKTLLKAGLPLMAMLVVGGALAGLLFGDGCGPVERGVRAALGTWDMWETPMVSPYELPHHAVPAGSIPVTGSDLFGLARRQLKEMDAVSRRQRSSLVFRRFCHHCHGPNGDGRIIVGESFGFRLPDLRTVAIQQLDDAALFHRLSRGSRKMIPLAATLSPLDRLLAIEYVRSLKDRPSSPFFKPRWENPAEKPGGPAGCHWPDGKECP